MAEGIVQNIPQVSEDKDKHEDENLECAVCLQTCVHPAQLPCGHIFCFLCVKGIANQSKKCAMCRQEIPRNFLEQPNLVQCPQTSENTQEFNDGYQWFYEGRNGWWQYDERTSNELEQLYKEGERTCELLIAGFLYILDLENMIQLRRNDPSRRRKIKRDFATVPKKGIAGLRYEESGLESVSAEPARSHDGDTTEIAPVTPTNSPQSSSSGRESPQEEPGLHATIEMIRSLKLDHMHVAVSGQNDDTSGDSL